MNNIVNYCKKHEKIYLYGAGYYGKILCLLLEERGIVPFCFLTTEPPEAREILGISVKRFDFALIDEKCGIVVSVGKKFRGEITAVLEANNITDYICTEEEELTFFEKNLKYNKEYPVRKNILVLLYHRVCKLQRNIRGMAISPENFESHIKFLKENYPILRFEDDWNEVREKSIVITFDDGYDDFYKYAMPILEKYAVPAMIFVSSGLLDGKKGFWTDGLEQMIFESKKTQFTYGKHIYHITDSRSKTRSFFLIRSLLKKISRFARQLALKEIENELNTKIHDDDEYLFLTKEKLYRIAQSPIISIGAHTVTHTSLSSESTESQMFELSTCKSDLEDLIKKPISCFSYPFGESDDFTEDTVTIARQCGYKKVASTFQGIASSCTPYGYIPRCGIVDCSVDEFGRQIRKYWAIYG